MSVWEGHAERYGVFYPMQTFSKQREVDFQEVPFFIEAKRAEDTELLKAIASTLSEKVYEADSEQRKSLHLAAVFICNFTNHMYALAADLLEKYNLPFEVMLPLIDIVCTVPAPAMQPPGHAMPSSRYPLYFPALAAISIFLHS